jgi:hypothetical protein
MPQFIVGAAILGFCVLTVVDLGGDRFAAPGGLGVVMGVTSALLTLSVAVCGLGLLFARPQLIVNRGYLEIRHRLFGLSRSTRFSEASLTVRHRCVGRNHYCELALQTHAGSTPLWRCPSNPGGEELAAARGADLGRYLAQITGWPLQGSLR